MGTYNPNTKESVIQNLKDADCTPEVIQQFLALEGKEKEQIKILRCHRCALMETVRKCQKKVDCLDYLIYKMNK